MHDLHPVGLTRSQEPHHLYIHNRYLLKVQNKPRSVILELIVQLRDVLRLELTTQAERGFSALRSLFDLHVSAALIQALTANTQCMHCANADFTDLTWFAGCERLLNCQES
jgi:hypothetical protein